MTRDEFEDWLASLGGRLAKNTTRNTDLVIVGEEPGNAKWDLARKYGVPTMHWSMWNYFGFLRNFGPCTVDIPDHRTLGSLVIQMAVLCEEVLAHAELGGNEYDWIAFEWLSTGLEGLLASAWPDTGQGDSVKKRGQRDVDLASTITAESFPTRRSRMLG